jgi:hypothetical protein
MSINHITEVYTQTIDERYGYDFWFSGKKQAELDTDFNNNPILNDNSVTSPEYFVMYLFGYYFVKQDVTKFYETLEYIALNYSHIDKRFNVHRPHLDPDNIFSGYIDKYIKKFYYKIYSKYYFNYY